MDYGYVRSLKLSLPITDFGAEAILAEFDGRTQKLAPMKFWNCENNLAQALIEFPKNMNETIKDIQLEPQIGRWILSQKPNDIVLVQLFVLPGYAIGKQIDAREEWLVLRFSCDFLSLVDAYRFMLKEFLDTYGPARFKTVFHEDFPNDELRQLDKMATAR